jgi:hypothetical protein
MAPGLSGRGQQDIHRGRGAITLALRETGGLKPGPYESALRGPMGQGPPLIVIYD